MMMWAAIGAGGAAGAMARYAMAGAVTRLIGPNFPWGTLAVNVLGGLVMGLLVGIMAAKWSPSAEIRAFLTTGLLGGFTTFSAFSLEAWLLIERHDYGLAALYIAASVLLSIGSLALGLYLVRVMSA
ncbi:MAG TPA: fluoride efflux transporter CrcB [Micropepsaceae bacterium]|nr:fluoride efflux transporter CrcB [Micropepsaceae bacterium]